MNELSGFEKLKKAVESDRNKTNSCGCFNPNGCDVPNHRKGKKYCFHDYCNKFNWAVDRAKSYEEKLGLNWEDILNSWEIDRSYWYMNYYQEANQPEINSDRVQVFETVEEMLKSIGEKEFRCPACGGVSTNPYQCNSGIEENGKVCDWKVYGLFGDLGKGILVYCKDQLRGETIFMPLSWEKEAVIA